MTMLCTFVAVRWEQIAGPLEDDTALFEVRQTDSTGEGVFASGPVPAGSRLRFWGR